MVKRRKATPKGKRRTSQKTRIEQDERKSIAYNKNAQWQAFRQLQMRAEEAWEKFRDDVKRKVRSDILIRDHNHLLLLLGECNYMARECMRMSQPVRKKMTTKSR